MKCKSGERGFLPFVKNELYHQYAACFDHQDNDSNSLSGLFHSTLKNLAPADIHLEESTQLRSGAKNTRKIPRGLKRFDYNSEAVPSRFLNFKLDRSEPQFFDHQNGSPVRRLRKNSTASQAKTLLTVEELFSKEDPTRQSSSEENDQMKKFRQMMEEDASEEEDTDFEKPKLFRQSSANFRNKTTLLCGVIPVKNLAWKEAASGPLPGFEGEGIKRVQSVNLAAGNSRFSVPSRLRQDSVKFKVLEHKIKPDAVLSLVIIFNESTTLKLKLRPATNDDPEKITPFRLAVGLDNFASAEDEHLGAMQEALLNSNGKYTVVQAKPLMFSRDPVKSRLFELSLGFVQTHFWSETLQRFLELVEGVYNDQLNYYLSLQKLLCTLEGDSQIVEQTGTEATLSIEGQLGSDPVRVLTPLFSPGLSVDACRASRSRRVLPREPSPSPSPPPSPGRQQKSFGKSGTGSLETCPLEILKNCQKFLTTFQTDSLFLFES